MDTRLDVGEVDVSVTRNDSSLSVDEVIALGIVADIPIVGDQTNGLILPVLQGLGRAVRDVGQLRGEREAFGTRRQQHAVTTVRHRMTNPAICLSLA